MLSKSNPFEVVHTREVVQKIREIQKVEVEKIKKMKKVSLAQKMAHDIMKKYDKGSDGVLGKGEAREALRGILEDKSDDEVGRVFGLIDVNGDGEVGLEELVGLLTTVMD